MNPALVQKYGEIWLVNTRRLLLTYLHWERLSKLTLGTILRGPGDAGSLPDGRQSFRRRQDRPPRGSPLFPLVVRDLFDMGSVASHYEQFAVGLRRIRVDPFLLETHSGTGECDLLSIRCPSHVSFVAVH